MSHKCFRFVNQTKLAMCMPIPGHPLADAEQTSDELARELMDEYLTGDAWVYNYNSFFDHPVCPSSPHCLAGFFYHSSLQVPIDNDFIYTGNQF